MITKVKTPKEIAAMRESGRMLAHVLEYLKPLTVEGISTKELADAAAAELKRIGGQPVFKGYHGFPDVICISVNSEVVHGIPKRDCILKNGDVVGLDFGVSYKGMITDSAISVLVGNTGNARVNQLLTDTKRALDAGISVVRDGVQTGDIGAAVEAVLNKGKYGIVRDLVGHGVGHELHEDPNIPNYGKSGRGEVLQAGMTIAIEPMATLGSEDVQVEDDGWTITTRDGSIAAHFEHTVLITQDGSEIITQI